MEHVIKKICINSKNQSVTDRELNRLEEISEKRKLGTSEGDTERRFKKVKPNIEIRDDVCGGVGGRMAVGIEMRNINDEMENASMPCGAEITCIDQIARSSSDSMNHLLSLSRSRDFFLLFIKF